MTNCIDVTVIRSFCALVNIWKHRRNPKETDKKGDLRHKRPRIDIPLEAVCLPACFPSVMLETRTSKDK